MRFSKRVTANIIEIQTRTFISNDATAGMVAAIFTSHHFKNHGVGRSVQLNRHHQ